MSRRSASWHGQCATAVLHFNIFPPQVFFVFSSAFLYRIFKNVQLSGASFQHVSASSFFFVFSSAFHIEFLKMSSSAVLHFNIFPPQVFFVFSSAFLYRIFKNVQLSSDSFQNNLSNEHYSCGDSNSLA